MRYLKQIRPLAADVQQWRRISLAAYVPRDPSQPPDLSLLLLRQNGRVPSVDWIEHWACEAPLPETTDPARIIEWFHGALWDRLDQ